MGYSEEQLKEIEKVLNKEKNINLTDEEHLLFEHMRNIEKEMSLRKFTLG